jgi:hypothetical protein
MPKSVYIGFSKPSDLEVFSQRSPFVDPILCLGERRSMRLPISLDLLNSVHESRQHLLPFLLFKHGNIRPATPAIYQLCHGCQVTLWTESLSSPRPGYEPLRRGSRACWVPRLARAQTSATPRRRRAHRGSVARCRHPDALGSPSASSACEEFANLVGHVDRPRSRNADCAMHGEWL